MSNQQEMGRRKEVANLLDSLNYGDMKRARKRKQLGGEEDVLGMEEESEADPVEGTEDAALDEEQKAKKLKRLKDFQVL